MALLLLAQKKRSISAACETTGNTLLSLQIRTDFKRTRFSCYSSVNSCICISYDNCHPSWSTNVAGGACPCKTHCPCLRAVAGFAPGMSPRGAAWQWLNWLDVSAETSGKRHMTRGKLSFCKTKISISSRHLCPSLFRKILKATAIPIWFLRGTLLSLLQAEVGRDRPSDKISSSPLFSPSTAGKAAVYTQVFWQ